MYVHFFSHTLTHTKRWHIVLWVKATSIDRAEFRFAIDSAGPQQTARQNINREYKSSQEIVLARVQRTTSSFYTRAFLFARKVPILLALGLHRAYKHRGWALALSVRDSTSWSILRGVWLLTEKLDFFALFLSSRFLFSHLDWSRICRRNKHCGQESSSAIGLRLFICSSDCGLDRSRRPCSRNVIHTNRECRFALTFLLDDLNPMATGREQYRPNDVRTLWHVLFCCFLFTAREVTAIFVFVFEWRLCRTVHCVRAGAQWKNVRMLLFDIPKLNLHQETSQFFTP